MNLSPLLPYLDNIYSQCDPDFAGHHSVDDRTFLGLCDWSQQSGRYKVARMIRFMSSSYIVRIY